MFSFSKRRGKVNKSFIKDYLLFVVHWDLNKNHGVGRAPLLQIAVNRLPFVPSLGPKTEKLNGKTDSAHGGYVY